MQFKLIPYPGTTCPAVNGITVTAQRDGTLLRLLYRLEGNIAGLKIPPAAAPVPTEKLWEHTCFEFFFVEPGEDAYQEYNFAPSGAWDHYHFNDYREPGKGTKVRPTIKATQSDSLLQVAVELTLPTDDILDAAFAAVVEDKAGALTYWALKHTNEDEPDFHDAGAFVAEI